jgi:hypothetical protein
MPKSECNIDILTSSGFSTGGIVEQLYIYTAWWQLQSHLIKKIEKLEVLDREKLKQMPT